MSRRLLTALSCAALLGAGLARAEEQPAAPTPAPSPSAAPPAEPVPLPRVVERGEEAERAARKLETLAAPVPEVQQIEQTLPEQSAHLAERAKRVKALATDPGSLVALEEELRSWELSREQLSDTLTLLTDRLTDLEGALDELSQHRHVWKATEEAALQAVAPDTVVARIREVRTTLRDAKSSVEGRRDELLALQTRVAEDEKLAQAALDSLTEARTSFRSLLFLRDSRPLWSAVSAERQVVVPDLAETLGARWRSLKRFVEVRKERLGLHLALLVLTLAATFALRHRAAAWRADDPRLEASAVVFERPVSAALLLMAGLTPLLHPRAPRLADALGVLLVVIPALRLLPRLLDPALAPAVYALAVFAMLDRVRDVASKSVLFERSLLLVQALGALGFLAWMLRPERLATLPAGTRIPRWLDRTLHGALLALGVASVAIVLGWVHLGRALTEGVLGSAYVAVVLYGGARVVRTAVRAGLRTASAQRLGLVRRHGRDVNRWLRRAVHFGAFAGWAYFTLVGFGIADWTVEKVGGFLGAEATFGAAKLSLGDVLAFLVTLLGTFVFARVVRVVLEADVVPRLPARRGLGTAVTSTVQYALIGVGFLLAISAAGVDLNRVSLLAGALGVGVGFGLQNVVNNFVSGLILLYERPVQIGDMVDVGDVSGEVRRIGIRSSTIRTGRGAEVIVPNGELISNRVVNWTFSDRRRRVEIRVGVAYGTDPERVLALLVGVAKAHPDVLEEPPPQAVFVAFGESSLVFELQAWSYFDNSGSTQSDIAVGVSRALAEAGIEIPFPQRQLHLSAAHAKALATLGPDRD